VLSVRDDRMPRRESPMRAPLADGHGQGQCGLDAEAMDATWATSAQRSSGTAASTDWGRPSWHGGDRHGRGGARLTGRRHRSLAATPPGTRADRGPPDNRASHRGGPPRPTRGSSLLLRRQFLHQVRRLLGSGGTVRLVIAHSSRVFRSDRSTVFVAVAIASREANPTVARSRHLVGQTGLPVG